MVASAPRRLHSPRQLRRLRDVGRIPERPLHLRPVSLPILFAGNLRRSATRVVRSEAGMVAGAAAVFAGAAHFAVSRFVPGDVLLLSGRVLQGVLGGSAELRSGRTPEELSGGAILP